MSNHISSEVWGEITYPFPKFNGYIPLYNGYDYLPILGPNLIPPTQPPL